MGTFDPAYFDPAFFDTGDGSTEITVPPGVKIPGRYRAATIAAVYARAVVPAVYRLRTIPGRWRAPE